MRNRPTRLILTAVAAGVLAVGAPTVALASVTAPTAPAAAPAATPAAPSESQWKQLDHLATTPPSSASRTPAQC
ncbi:hypothetical protein F3K43_45665 [Streptomyces sp. LBUM 1476]|nr:hypothetical protein [Streptomyces sp. LBUM 1476]